jgi:hypothetical protein
MSRGRNNSLAKQIGEHLVCAELGRRGVIATPFSGNVPSFDILAADGECRTVPIQVKASTCTNWPSDARMWMRLSLNETTKIQTFLGAAEIENPELVYVHVAIAPLQSGSKDRFFVLTKLQLREVCIKRYSQWMGTIGWRRPRKHDCFECRYQIEDLEAYENNWKLIKHRLETSDLAPVLEP